MDQEKKKEIELNRIDLINENVEICVNETYELMINSNFLFAGILYVICLIFLFQHKQRFLRGWDTVLKCFCQNY